MTSRRDGLRIRWCDLHQSDGETKMSFSFTVCSYQVVLADAAQWQWVSGCFRWGAGDLDRFRRYAAELVALSPEVILAVGTSVVGPLLAATGSVPVVFVQVTDRRRRNYRG